MRVLKRASDCQITPEHGFGNSFTKCFPSPKLIEVSVPNKIEDPREVLNYTSVVMPLDLAWYAMSGKGEYGRSSGRVTHSISLSDNGGESG